MNRLSQGLLLLIAAALLWYGPAWTGMVNGDPTQRSSLVRPVAEARFATTVLDSGRPTLVEFGADWCGACRSLRPVVDRIASEHENLLQVVSVDLDSEPALASRYGVRSIPTLMLFRHGEVVDQVIGFVPGASLDRWLQSRLHPSPPLSAIFSEEAY